MEVWIARKLEKGYEVLENNARYAKVLLKHELTIPVSADESSAGESDIPVNFGGVTFFPEDYIYADLTGIILSQEPLDLDDSDE